MSWVFRNMAKDYIKPNAASYGVAIEVRREEAGEGCECIPFIIIIVWCASFQVMGHCGQREEAHKWLERMVEAGHHPNARTLKGGDQIR